MALARVQATPQVVTSSASSVAVTFSTPPIIGHGVVVGVASHDGLVADTCTDNHGHTYIRAKQQHESTAFMVVDLFYCAALTATGSPFTVTVAGSAGARLAVAIEVNSGLAVDQTAGGNTATNIAATGATLPLTDAEVFLVAAVSTNGGSFVTVGSGAVTWIEEAESLAGQWGEINSGIVTGALGMTPGATWTLDGYRGAVAAIAAFKAVVPPPEAALVETLPATGIYSRGGRIHGRIMPEAE